MKIKPESIVIIFLICTCLIVCKYLYSNEKLLEQSRSFVTKIGWSQMLVVKILLKSRRKMRGIKIYRQR